MSPSVHERRAALEEQYPRLIDLIEHISDRSLRLRSTSPGRVALALKELSAGRTQPRVMRAPLGDILAACDQAMHLSAGDHALHAFLLPLTWRDLMPDRDAACCSIPAPSHDPLVFKPMLKAWLARNQTPHDTLALIITPSTRGVLWAEPDGVRAIQALWPW